MPRYGRNDPGLSAQSRAADTNQQLQSSATLVYGSKRRLPSVCPRGWSPVRNRWRIGRRYAFQPGFSPENELVFGVEPAIFSSCSHPLENDAGSGELPEFTRFLRDDAFQPRLDAVFATAESDHVSVEVEPTIPAVAVQCELNSLL